MAICCQSGMFPRRRHHHLKILHNSSQEDLFDKCAIPVIAGCFEGFNGAIICYGQTGAGKTFTMTGYVMMVVMLDIAELQRTLDIVV